MSTSSFLFYLSVLYILCIFQRDSSSPGGDSQSSGDGYTACTERARADSQSSSEGVHSDSSADRPRTDSQSSREERSTDSPNRWVINNVKVQGFSGIEIFFSYVNGEN